MWDILERQLSRNVTIFCHWIMKTTIVLAATTPTDDYYGKEYEAYRDFQIAFAKTIHQHDQLIVVLDATVASDYREHLPIETVLEFNMGDIWMRDFSPVRSNKQALFKYQPSYLSKADSKYIQKRFEKLLRHNNFKHLMPIKCSLVLDGGNVVDNFVDKAILTDRVCKDNPKYSKHAIVEELKSVLGYRYIAIIPDLGDRTGHSDGIVAFIDENVLAITALSEADDKLLRVAVEEAFGVNKVKMVTLPSICPNERWKGFDSACGLHVNLIYTMRHLYVPIFGKCCENQQKNQSEELDSHVLSLIQSNTSKKVIPIHVPYKVCRMGGSVRCLSWQSEFE